MSGKRRSRINLDEWLRIYPQTSIQFSPSETSASEDIIKETNELFIMHLRGVLEQFSITLLSSVLTNITPSNRFETLKNLAKDFEESPQRMKVFELAHDVDLDTVNFKTFQELLNDLFQRGGVMHERILVLFYFCTDFYIRILMYPDRFIRVYSWTLYFFKSKLANWIQLQGGWENL